MQDLFSRLTQTTARVHGLRHKYGKTHEDKKIVKGERLI